MVNVGDYVKYNGKVVEDFESYEKDFINRYLKIGKSYKVTEIDRYEGVLWYRIITNDPSISYWIPYESFDINIKDKYGLK